MKAIEIKKTYGIETRRVQYYVDLGLVECKTDPGRGPSGRDFSRDNVLQVLIIHELSAKCGLELKVVRRILAFVKEHLPGALTCNDYEVENPPGAFLRIYDGGDAISIGRRRDHETLQRTNTITLDMSDDKNVLVVNLSRIHDEL